MRFNHSFTTPLLADYYDIRTLQEVLGHRDIATTMIHTHGLNVGTMAVKNPADPLTAFSPSPVGGLPKRRPGGHDSGVVELANPATYDDPAARGDVLAA